MPNQLVRARHLAFRRQSGRCFYCRFPMWEKDAQAFAEMYAIPIGVARELQCTAEHLQAKRDGGSSAPKNIAAACIHCNRSRHHKPRARTPSEHSAFVRRRLECGRWHQSVLVKRLGGTPGSASVESRKVRRAAQSGVASAGSLV
jgi:hypothetical protein